MYIVVAACISFGAYRISHAPWVCGRRRTIRAYLSFALWFMYGAVLAYACSHCSNHALTAGILYSSCLIMTLMASIDAHTGLVPMWVLISLGVCSTLYCLTCVPASEIWAYSAWSVLGAAVLCLCLSIGALLGKTGDVSFGVGGGDILVLSLSSPMLGFERSLYFLLLACLCALLLLALGVLCNCILEKLHSLLCRVPYPTKAVPQHRQSILQKRFAWGPGIALAWHMTLFLGI